MSTPCHDPEPTPTTAMELLEGFVASHRPLDGSVVFVAADIYCDLYVQLFGRESKGSYGQPIQCVTADGWIMLHRSYGLPEGMLYAHVESWPLHRSELHHDWHPSYREIL